MNRKKGDTTVSKIANDTALERVRDATDIREPRRRDTELSVIGVMRRLPNLVLVPGVVALFALLLTDLAVADPLPVIDEAAIFWTMINGLKVIIERRRARKLVDREVREPEVVADVVPEHVSAPGQPLVA
jgi:hypothetical protein